MDYGLSAGARVGGTAAPVTLDDIKDHLRIDGTAEDAVLSAYLSACIERVEGVKAHVLQPRQFTLALRGWRGSEILIPRYPLISIDSVTYLQQGETTPATLSSSLYMTETVKRPPRLVMRDDALYPSDELENGYPVTVTFTAGYEDGAYPAMDVHAIKLMCGHYYEHREAVVTGTIAAEIPAGLHDLLMTGRMW